MEKSEQINELAMALSKAQGEMGNALKSSDNPFYKSKYADLAEVLDTCREVLSKNGLSVSQPVGQLNDKSVEVYTILMHSSGQWISSSMNIPLTKLDPQAAGSAITYARRYSLAAIVGIAQADDDGESAMPFVRKTKDAIMVFTQMYVNLNTLNMDMLKNMVRDVKYKDAWDDIKKLLTTGNGNQPASDNGNTPPPANTPNNVNHTPPPNPVPTDPGNCCEVCGAKVSDAVKTYCRKNNMRILCMTCQKK